MTDELIELLRDSDPAVRRNAITRAGQKRLTAAVPELKEIGLHDPDLHCRKFAMYWLRLLDDIESFNEVIAKALFDREQTICSDAAWNICQLHQPDPEIVATVIQVLQNSHEEDFAFPMMLAALGRLGDSRAYEAIVAHLHSASGFVRGLTAKTLGDLRDKRAIAELAQLVNDREIAWQEDYGPELTVSEIARDAINALNR